MTTIPPRSPLFAVLRLLALGWTLLSLLGLVVGVLAVIYAGASGCVGHHVGWFGCTLAVSMLPFGSAVSLVTAMTMLFFMHLFYLAGAQAEEYQSRRSSLRERAGGLVFDVVADILD